MVVNNLNITRKSSVDWRSFCSEVTENWFHQQAPIGGVNITVEIDETLLAKCKYGRGRQLVQVWLFGGIERESKKRFIVPLLDEDNCPIPRSKEVLIPIIQKYILPGSIVYSDMWKAYSSLTNEGYAHYGINHSLNFVNPDEPHIHTQNIERLWRDVKEIVKRPGMRTEYIKQYLGRYLFIKRYGNNSLHHFLTELKNLYPPSLTATIQPIRANPIPENEED